MGFKRPNEQMAGYLEDHFIGFSDDIRDEMILRKDFIKAQRLVALAKTMSADIRSRVGLIGSMLNQSHEAWRRSAGGAMRKAPI